MNTVKKFSRSINKYTVIQIVTRNGAMTFLLLMLILNCIITPNFLNFNTFWNLVIQSSAIIFVAMGMTFVISSGGIDISVGSIMAIAGMVAAYFLPRFGIIYAVLICVFVGLLTGMFSGFIISTFKIQPIIITLAIMIAGRGVAKLIGKGNIISLQNDIFLEIALKRFYGIPIQLVYVVIVVAIFLFIAKKTIFSRYIEAMGDNYQASVLSGIKTDKMTVLVYCISGLMAAIAGLLTVARTSASDPDTVGMGEELNAIAAVAIGGTPMSGGKARIIGTLIGALIIQLITITFNMNDIPYDWALIAKTIIIILAVYVQKINIGVQVKKVKSV